MAYLGCYVRICGDYRQFSTAFKSIIQAKLEDILHRVGVQETSQLLLEETVDSNRRFQELIQEQNEEDHAQILLEIRELAEQINP